MDENEEEQIGFSEENPVNLYEVVLHAPSKDVRYAIDYDYLNRKVGTLNTFNIGNPYGYTSIDSNGAPIVYTVITDIWKYEPKSYSKKWMSRESNMKKRVGNLGLTWLDKGGHRIISRLAFKGYH